jgi:hypothetical protein
MMNQSLSCVHQTILQLYLLIIIHLYTLKFCISDYASAIGIFSFTPMNTGVADGNFQTVKPNHHDFSPFCFEVHKICHISSLDYIRCSNNHAIHVAAKTPRRLMPTARGHAL